MTTTPPANPLRILRSLMQGDDSRVTQAHLASLTGIPLDSIRNLETNRRALIETHLMKILDELGAQWDPKKAEWHLACSPEIPYTKAMFKLFTSPTLDTRERRKVDVHMLLRRLIELFLDVEPEDYQKLFYRVYHFLDDLRAELRIHSARKAFEKTRFEMDPRAINVIARKFSRMADAELVATEETKEGERLVRW
jgi:hypothetical protein